MHKLSLIIISLILINGCSFQETLNMQRFYYGVYPSQIFWVILPGLKDSHLTLTKFYAPNTIIKNSWEKSHCIGKTWSFNLYKSNPSINDAIISQLVGNDNPKNSSVGPIWSHFKSRGHQSAILEIASEESPFDLQNKKFFKDLIYFKMEKKKNPKDLEFSYTDKLLYQKGKTYFDQSCNLLSKECQNSPLSNINYIHQYLKRNQEQFLFIIIDYRFLKSITQNKKQEAYKVLAEYDELINKIHEDTFGPIRPLSVISTVNTIGDEEILGTVFATGARAENFCGIYGQQEILHRMKMNNKESEHYK